MERNDSTMHFASLKEQLQFTAYDPKVVTPWAENVEETLRHLEDLCLKSNLYNWSHRSEVCDSPPGLMYLSTTNACNHKCKVCAWKDVMRRGRIEGEKQMGLMSFDLFKRIVDQIPEGVARVYLNKIGEPTLHPELPQMMEYIKTQRPELEIAMHTNMTRMDNPDLRQAVLQYLDFFTISIFSITREEYQITHGKDDYDLVFGNVDAFYEDYKKAERKPRVFFDYVRQQTNQDSPDDEVFKFFHERYPDFSTGIHYTFNYQGFGEEGHLQLFEKLPDELYPICTLPWMSFTILWDGKVDYCFVEPQEKYFLGNVNEASIMEIWNSEPYRDFRRMMIEHRFDEMREKEICCKTCSWLFALRTQSVPILTLGTKRFNNKIDRIYQNVRENEIRIAGEEHLISGFLNFLRGEISEAFMDFHMADEVTTQSEVKQTAQRWIENIKKIFGMRKNVESWERLLHEEEESLRNIHITKYAVTKNEKPMRKKYRTAYAKD